ncbi:MAG: 50S ribosomal protein L25 [Firmicutes bacterium ADurb.Bin356]|nr:MAG: 50S ribosomal protein L25 [Firmicutes bacterium ADurb.Bin356]
MFALNAQNRDMGLKPKQLRRNGIIPGVLYGKNMDESLSIQFSQAETERFLKTNSTGSKAELVLGAKKYPALLREVEYKPATSELIHLSFQMLLAGEIVTSTARIILVNRDKIAGLVNQPLAEVSYRALPSHLVEKIELNLDNMKIGDEIRVSDLEFAKNPNIEILSPLDALVFSISELRKLEVSEPEEAAEPEAE